MTCIIGVSENGKAYIGADSCASDRYVRRATQLSKVFQNGPFLIGYTDSFRMGQVLQYHLRVETQDTEDDLQYMVCRFAEAVRDCLKQYGFSHIENNEETGGSFIVAYRQCIYEINSDFQVNCYRDGVAAVGSGAAYAYGALEALKNVEPQKRIVRALEIASGFSPYVMPPFTIIKSVV